MSYIFNSKVKNVALAYKNLLNLKVTDSSLEKDIDENPFYPSLLSISDAFDKYRINNIAYKVPTEHFDNLEAPFIAFLDLPMGGSDFVLVTEISDIAVSYVYDKTKPQTIPKARFIELFKNIIFLAEPGKESGEEGYSNRLKNERTSKNKRKLWFAAISAIFFGIAAADLAYATVLPFSIIAILKFSGLLCTGLLLVYEMDRSNIFVKSICGASTKTNCDSVLSSKAAKMGGISWSEIGFFYFAFTTILLLFPGPTFLFKAAWLSLFNLLAAPFILFSIYYQWRIVKQWCPLCLTIQSILAGELIWSAIFSGYSSRSFHILFAGGVVPLLQIALLGMLAIAIWYGLKPYFLKAKDYNSYKTAFRRLQTNPDVFHSRLGKEEKAVDGWHDLGINLGNPDAPNIIMSVCSTSCVPCAEAHPKLEQIIKHNADARLKIIFTPGTTDHDHRLPAVRHLLAIAEQNDMQKTQQALDDWFLFGKLDYNKFSKKYPLNGELNLQNQQIDAMRAWCSKAEINYTPTMFVNGYRLPEDYEIDDLEFIL